MATRRTVATVRAKAPRSRAVEVQVRLDEHGTPLVWVCEEGRAPQLVVGRRALEALRAGIDRALEASAGERRPRQAAAEQLSLVDAATLRVAGAGC